MQKPPRKAVGRDRGGRGKKDETEPMSVFCRIRPCLDDDSERVSWLSVLSSRVLAISNSDPCTGRTKTSQFTFRNIFDEHSTQKDVFAKVALPLVENVLQGKNSLLFAYGVTGSGKTYTMNGTGKEGGIMPRCLDVIFNSIVDCQAPKYVFKPDRLNGFDVQSEADAESDRRSDLVNLISSAKSSRQKMTKKPSDPDLAQRLVDPTKVECIDEENLYSVFVTLVEIYNNNVFDLLEDFQEECIRPKPLQSKIIREDSSHNMFIHGVTEVEVSSTEEAFEVFCRGQKRRRVAHTALNAESSRSHTVFTIRVVQGPLEKKGTNTSKHLIGVGQLSLVDLAGSERTTRTNNTGMRLREAGNINNSLMTLRSCLELLRENQAGANKVVPYRDSRLTHLFKTFFEGEGQVSMIVCLNPHPDNYEESLHVLKFAEMSQEVQITAATPMKPPSSYAPGRRRANNAFNNALKRLNSDSSTEDINSGEDGPPPAKVRIPEELKPFDFPSLNEKGDEAYCNEIKSFLQVRKQISTKEIECRSEEITHFRTELVKNLKDAYLSVEELKLTKSMLAREKSKAQSLDDKTSSLEVEVGILKKKLDDSEKENKRIRLEVSEKEKIISKKNAQKDRVKEKFITKTQEYQDRMKEQFEDRLRRQKTEMEIEIRNKEKKLREVQRVLSDEVLSTPSVASTRSRFETQSTYVPTPRPLNTDRSRKPAVAVANRRHRRSRSAGDTWLEHRPQAPVPLNTVMQPHMKKRKSVTKLTDAKDVTDGPSKYCLMTQNQDSDGDLETRLYKGDVIPTSGGGAQVMFNDIEILKQISPSSSPSKKSDFGTKDPSTSCAIAIEGHGPRLRSRKH